MDRVKAIQLRSVADYSDDRISFTKLSPDNYIGTDNLLQSKLGKTNASYTPRAGLTAGYRKGDILIGNIRPYLKKIWYATGSGGSSADVLTIRVKKDNDSKFVYYSLFRDDFFKHMMRGSKGTKMPRGDKTQVLDFLIPDFSITIQQKIASVLSSLDSRIELNNKINLELELMSKTLYNYWFVQFDFLNKSGKPYKTSGGKMVYNEELKREIPEGWEVGNLASSKISKILDTGINEFQGNKIYLSTSEVDGTEIVDHSILEEFASRTSRANMQPTENSIWFARMKETKKVLLISEFSKEIIDNYIFSTGFAGVGSPKESLYYLWNFINNPYFEAMKDTNSTGSTQKSIINESIANIKLLIPDNNILCKFNDMVYSFYKQIYLNQKENKELSELRDWLLPMLMNGQVTVK